jgi:hypothetical protein
LVITIPFSTNNLHLFFYFEGIYERLLINREGQKTKLFSEVFKYMENVKGKRTNILDGLKLHTNVFDPFEQARITDFVYAMQKLGQEGRLKGIHSVTFKFCFALLINFVNILCFNA